MHLILCFSFLLVSHLLPVSAENSIQILAGSDKSNLECSENVCKGPAKVAFENNDLFNMGSFKLQDNDESLSEYEFVKMDSTTRTYNDGSEQVSWHGTLMDGNRMGSATLVQLANGDFGASLITDTKSYTLVTMPDGSTEVRSFLWKNVPPGTIIQSIEFPVEFDKNNDGSSLSKIENNMVAVGSESIKVPQTYKYSEGQASQIIQGPQGRRHLQAQSSKTTVDMIFFVTNRAMCQAAGSSIGCQNVEYNWRPMVSELNTVMGLTNSAMQSVGANVEIRLLNIYFLDRQSGDFFPDGETIDFISRNPTVQQLREENGADLVSFVGSPIYQLNGGTTCGIGTLLNPWTINGYDFICNGILTITHEFGHNFNGKHNRENTPQQLWHPYAHGYQIPGILRTVMSYGCEASGRPSCDVVPYFSSNGYVIRGFSLGDESHDNARNIQEKAPTVAGWKPCKVNCPTIGKGGGGGGCLSMVNTVNVKDKGSVTMDQVHIGDYVHIGQGKYSKVYSFSHIDRDLEAEFFQIHLIDLDAPLELTPDHMVYVFGHPVRGSDVKVGDMLGEHMVSSVQVIKRRGVYAPVTYSGNLLVSGVSVSSYVAVLDDFSAPAQHVASHVITGLHRMVCLLHFDVCVKETYNDGISTHMDWAIQMVQALNHERVWLQMLVWMVGLPVLGLIYAIQHLSQAHLLAALILAVFGSYHTGGSMKKVAH